MIRFAKIAVARHSSWDAAGGGQAAPTTPLAARAANDSDGKAEGDYSPFLEGFRKRPRR